MAIDFPASPTVGQQYVFGGITYVYTSQGVWTVLLKTGLPSVGFRAHKNAVDQTGIANGTYTKITFTTEEYDQTNYYDTANSRWMPPAGIIHIDTSVYANAGLSASGINHLAIYKNGAMLKRAVVVAPAQAFQALQVSVDDVASGTDFYEVFLNPQTAGTVTVNGAIDATFFDGHVVSAQGLPGPQGAQGNPGSSNVDFVPQSGRLILGAASPATTLKFVPYLGDRIKINGVIYPIPATEITSGTTGVYVNGVAGQTLAVSTFYYIYLFNNAGTLAFDFSTTGHVTSSTAGNVGVEIKSGDDSRTLIGIVVVSGALASAFYDQPQYRFVRSWFNRQRALLNGGFFNFGPAGSTSPAATGAVVFWVQFAGETVTLAASGTIVNNTASQNNIFYFYTDGGNPTGQYHAVSNWGGNTYNTVGFSTSMSVAEGLQHNSQVYYSVSGGGTSGSIEISGAIG